MHRKQIELWGIKSTSGNFRSYQIQTAIIHFKFSSAIALTMIIMIVINIFLKDFVKASQQFTY